MMSKRIINEWIYEAEEKENFEKARIFARTLQIYEKHTQGKLGCVGIWYENSIKAVALMELVSNDIYLCDLSSKDDYSGSMLMKTIVLSYNSKIKS